MSRVIGMTEKVLNRCNGTECKSYLESFRYDCLVRNLTRKTVDGYLERLNYLLRYLGENDIPLTRVDRRVIQDYIMHLKDKVSDETINGRIRAYRRFFNYLAEEGLWDGINPMTGIKLVKAAHRVKPVVEPETVQKIVGSIDRSTFEGNRNLMPVLLLWDGMLRMNEALKLKMTDIDAEKQLLMVFGKGRKERMVPIGVKAIEALHHYQIKWRSKYPGEYLITMRNGEPLTARRCHKLIQDIGKTNGVSRTPTYCATRPRRGASAKAAIQRCCRASWVIRACWLRRTTCTCRARMPSTAMRSLVRVPA